jgi:cytochrome c oxidase subunit 2
LHGASDGTTLRRCATGILAHVCDFEDVDSGRMPVAHTERAIVMGIRFTDVEQPALLAAEAASPVGILFGSGWWLPPDYARHGVAIDLLFNWIFWITLAAFAVVHVVLIVFLVRYRRRGDTSKARYVKGNLRLELIWYAIPTIIFAALAVASAKVWDDYRYSAEDSNAANILVIGQQFKWNIIYPGKDGKFGRYLQFPKPTDAAWPHNPGDTQHLFMGVPGPASLPYVQAVAAINQYISQPGVQYQLGKDMADPAGMDDDYEDALGRTLYLPVNRPVHVTVMSRDVIHDFYLPNFRVQLYAVPGMVGSVSFTPTQTSAAMGPAHLEVVCNQLCGIGHSQMKADIVVLAQEEYHRRFEQP